MGKHTGFATGWDKTDVTDTRPCFKCHRKMRHRHADETLFPGTVVHRTGGYCSGCAVSAALTRKAKTPQEEAARLEAAKGIERQIRARRQRLGITPDGKVLPRRVMTG